MTTPEMFGRKEPAPVPSVPSDPLEKVLYELGNSSDERVRRNKTIQNMVLNARAILEARKQGDSVPADRARLDQLEESLNEELRALGLPEIRLP